MDLSPLESILFGDGTPRTASSSSHLSSLLSRSLSSIVSSPGLLKQKVSEIETRLSLISHKNFPLFLNVEKKIQEAESRLLQAETSLDGEKTTQEHTKLKGIKQTISTSLEELKAQSSSISLLQQERQKLSSSRISANSLNTISLLVSIPTLISTPSVEPEKALDLFLLLRDLNVSRSVSATSIDDPSISTSQHTDFFVSLLEASRTQIKSLQSSLIQTLSSPPLNSSTSSRVRTLNLLSRFCLTLDPQLIQEIQIIYFQSSWKYLESELEECKAIEGKMEGEESVEEERLTRLKRGIERWREVVTEIAGGWMGWNSSNFKLGKSRTV
jgi:hypothetical protein